MHDFSGFPPAGSSSTQTYAEKHLKVCPKARDRRRWNYVTDFIVSTENDSDFGFELPRYR